VVVVDTLVITVFDWCVYEFCFLLYYTNMTTHSCPPTPASCPPSLTSSMVTRGWEFTPGSLLSFHSPILGGSPLSKATGKFWCQCVHNTTYRCMRCQYYAAFIGRPCLVMHTGDNTVKERTGSIQGGGVCNTIAIWASLLAKDYEWLRMCLTNQNRNSESEEARQHGNIDRVCVFFDRAGCIPLTLLTDESKSVKPTQCLSLLSVAIMLHDYSAVQLLMEHGAGLHTLRRDWTSPTDETAMRFYINNTPNGISMADREPRKTMFGKAKAHSKQLTSQLASGIDKTALQIACASEKELTDCLMRSSGRLVEYYALLLREVNCTIRLLVSLGSIDASVMEHVSDSFTKHTPMSVQLGVIDYMEWMYVVCTHLNGAKAITNIIAQYDDRLTHESEGVASKAARFSRDQDRLSVIELLITRQFTTFTPAARDEKVHDALMDDLKCQSEEAPIKALFHKLAKERQQEEIFYQYRDLKLAMENPFTPPEPKRELKPLAPYQPAFTPTPLSTEQKEFAAMSLEDRKAHMIATGRLRRQRTVDDGDTKATHELPAPTESPKREETNKENDDDTPPPLLEASQFPELTLLTSALLNVVI
jgi:hypothetical protein